MGSKWGGVRATDSSTSSEGFDALPDLVRIMINAAMKIEREKHLGV